MEPAALLQFEEDRAGGGVERRPAPSRRASRSPVPGEKPSGEVEKALRLLEVALGDAEKAEVA